MQHSEIIYIDSLSSLTGMTIIRTFRLVEL